MDFPQASEHESTKRLSSIKSILNPDGASDAAEMRGGSPRSSYRSPDPTPGVVTNEGDVAKAEKRAALQREAEYMRALLAAKERELAEL
jgi:hypothetical protein